MDLNRLQGLQRFSQNANHYNNLGNLPFARHSAQTVSTDGVRAQFWHSELGLCCEVRPTPIARKSLSTAFAFFQTTGVCRIVYPGKYGIFGFDAGGLCSTKPHLYRRRRKDVAVTKNQLLY